MPNLSKPFMATFPYFHPLTLHDLEPMLRRRPGEIKLGERMWIGDPEKTNARFVIVGIPEDIGVRANHGIGGARTLWPAFLKGFLNMHHSSFLPADQIAVWGAFDFSPLEKDLQDPDAFALRPLVDQIDAAVMPVIRKIVALGKIPVVIGGGHNNAYPILQGCATGSGETKPMATINIDAHADFRVMEGRHSGNAFRYAWENGYLDKYAVVGLQSYQNHALILETFLQEPDLLGISWERIFLKEELTLNEALDQAVEHTGPLVTGLEFDIDSIKLMASSAWSPNGFTTAQGRHIIMQLIKAKRPVYLHFCEGAVALDTGETDPLVGKYVATLLADAIVAFNS